MPNGVGWVCYSNSLLESALHSTVVDTVMGPFDSPTMALIFFFNSILFLVSGLAPVFLLGRTPVFAWSPGQNAGSPR